MLINSLYYPYISVPDNLWLRRAILYWDTINPIVPYTIQKDIPKNHISKELEKYGLLDFIRPEEYYGRSNSDDFSQDYINIVTNENFLTRIGPPGKRKYTEYIHEDKFCYRLLDDIKKIKLFIRDGDWLYFEKNAGKIYMGHLASYLAKLLHLDPVTDKIGYRKGFITAQLSPSSNTEIFPSLILEGLLPVPKKKVPVKAIVKFRDKHRVELLSFRKSLRETITTLESIKNDAELKRQLDCIKDNLQHQSLLLDSKLHEDKIDTVYGTLETTFNLKKPEILTTLGVSISSAPISAIGFGAYAMMSIGKEIYKGIKRRNSILQANPYSYYLNVKKKFK